MKQFNPAKRSPWFALLALSTLLTSCAGERLLLEPVGPPPAAGRTGGGEGRLVVFSAREAYTSVDVQYFHHSSYRITTPEGAPVKFVRNHGDARDSRPEAVALPAGLYTVIAKAEGAGTVTVPVLMEPLKTTEVHLVRDWKPDLTGHDRSDLVLLPDGRPVGWRAPVKSHEEIDEAKAKRADAVVKVKLVKAPDAFGKLAYALVEPIAVIRNRTEQTFRAQFTVGYADFTKGVPAGTSNIYLKRAARDDGHTEWRLLED